MCRLDHDDGQREAGNQAVAAREVPGLRAGAGRHFRNQGAGFRDRRLQFAIFLRIDDVDAAGENCDGSRGERGAVGVEEGADVILGPAQPEKREGPGLRGRFF